MDVLLILVLGAVAYRVGRFIALDTLIEDSRDRFLNWLATFEQDGLRHQTSPHDFGPYGWQRVHIVRRKLYSLITCPFCVTAYTSAGACILHRIFVGSFAMPVWTWLAVWTVSLVYWAIIDSEG